MDVCVSASSAMVMECAQGLRAAVTVEQDFGPDRIITVLRNGFGRMILRRWPVIQIIGGQWSPAIAPPQWQSIDAAKFMLEQPVLTAYGTITPDSAADGPNAVLVTPGIVSWWNGRLGTLLQVTYLNGWPVCGIDQSVIAGATSVHVDDITGWWNGIAGARGTIYDPPWREEVSVTGAPTPDTTGATSGPGTLPISALQFPHTPIDGQSNVPNQNVLLTTMPRSLLQGVLYFTSYFGLLRGAQAAVQQRAGGQTVSGGGGVDEWYTRAVEISKHYARVQF